MLPAKHKKWYTVVLLGDCSYSVLCPLSTRAVQHREQMEPALVCSNGATIKVSDLVCWRFLDGRPCLTAKERRIAQTTQAVIIIIPVRGSRRERVKAAAAVAAARGRHAIQPHVGVAPPHAAGSALSGTGQSTQHQPPANNSQSSNMHATSSTDPAQGQCTMCHSMLEAAGIRTALDADFKTTPGAKFHAWERLGIPLRIELGPQELASKTLCLSLHPSIAHLLPTAQEAALRCHTANAEDRAGARVINTVTGSTEILGGCDIRTASGVPACKRKLTGLSMQQLIASSKAVLQELHIRAADAHQPGSTGCSQVRCMHDGTSSSMYAAGLRACPRLHLWPHLMAAAHAPETPAVHVAVDAGASPMHGAAVQAERCAVATRDGSSTRSSGPEISRQDSEHTAHLSHIEDATQGMGDGISTLPCIGHLRAMLGMGRACQCGYGHVSMEHLRNEIMMQYACMQGRGGLHSQGCDPQPVQWRLVQRVGSTCTVEDADVSAEAYSTDDGAAITAGGSASNVQLAVGCIPSWVLAAHVQAALVAALAPFGVIRVIVPSTRGGTTHGWAHAILPSQEAAVQALKAHGHPKALTLALPSRPAAGTEHKAQDDDTANSTPGDSHKDSGSELISGTRGQPPEPQQEILSVPIPSQACTHVQVELSPCAGRVDALFALLPYRVRRRMRVDAVGAYSVTDQAAAYAMTSVLASLARAFLLQPQQQARQSVPKEGQALHGSACGSNMSGSKRRVRSRGSSIPHSGLLPLSVMDGTACSGGNTLSLMQSFAHVVGVEMDEERADDLQYNVRLVRTHMRMQQQHAPAATQQQASSPKQQAEQQQTAEPPADGMPAASLPWPGQGMNHAGTGLVDVMHADFVQMLLSFLVHAGPSPGRPCKQHAEAQADASAAVHLMSANDISTGAASSQRPAAIFADMVFLDPPWGGPQYHQPSMQANAASASAAASRSVGTAAPPSLSAGAVLAALGLRSSSSPSIVSTATDNHHTPTLASPQHTAALLSPAACWLADVPLHQLLALLLGKAGVRMVAIKLPRSTDVDAMEREMLACWPHATGMQQTLTAAFAERFASAAAFARGRTHAGFEGGKDIGAACHAAPAMAGICVHDDAGSAGGIGSLASESRQAGGGEGHGDEAGMRSKLSSSSSSSSSSSENGTEDEGRLPRLYKLSAVLASLPKQVAACTAAAGGNSVLHAHPCILSMRLHMGRTQVAILLRTDAGSLQHPKGMEAMDARKEKGVVGMGGGLSRGRHVQGSGLQGVAAKLRECMRACCQQQPGLAYAWGHAMLLPTAG